ncbi:hypothetical protein GCM10027180_03260 [Microbulbifer echini]
MLGIHHMSDTLQCVDHHRLFSFMQIAELSRELILERDGGVTQYLKPGVVSNSKLQSPGSFSISLYQGRIPSASDLNRSACRVGFLTAATGRQAISRCLDHNERVFR